MDKGNLSVLIVGLFRPFAWLVGAYLATSYRNWFAVVGCVLCAFCSVPVALFLANYPIPQLVLTVASLLSTPAVVCVVAGIAYSARNYKALLKWASNPVQTMKKNKR